MHFQEWNMDKKEYRKIVECLQGKINDKKLQKQAIYLKLKTENYIKRRKTVKF